MKKRYTGDLWLPVGVLLTAALLAAALFLLSEQGRQVQVTVDGTVVATLPLDTDTTRVIEGAGGSNRVVIKDGRVRVEEADCPDGLCVGQGAISRAGQTIVCLPHRLVVTVLGGRQTVDGEV